MWKPAVTQQHLVVWSIVRRPEPRGLPPLTTTESATSPALPKAEAVKPDVASVPWRHAFGVGIDSESC